jgi:hypothetical protein
LTIMEKCDTSTYEKIIVFKVQTFENNELWKLTNARLIVGLAKNLGVQDIVKRMLLVNKNCPKCSYKID